MADLLLDLPVPYDLMLPLFPAAPIPNDHSCHYLIQAIISLTVYPGILDSDRICRLPGVLPDWTSHPVTRASATTKIETASLIPLYEYV